MSCSKQAWVEQSVEPSWFETVHGSFGERCMYADVAWAKEEQDFERMLAIGGCPDGSLAIWQEEQDMGRWCIAVPMLLLCLGTSHGGGFVLKEENDAFSGSDDQYTQGLELMFVDAVKVDRKGKTTRDAYGLRNLMYTPMDIGIETNQPGDRPWAGLSALVWERWQREVHTFRCLEVSLGVVGEQSQSDHVQTWFHERTDNQEPMGWHNQIPSEPFVNVGIHYFRPLWVVGSGDEWKFDISAIYGANVGTAFVNGEAGWLARVGWRVPDDYMADLIKPTVAGSNRMSAYVFAGQETRYVLHNVTLGGSLWQDGPSKGLEPFVFDIHAGASLGLQRIFGSSFDFECAYSVVRRSEEFEGQKNPVDFGAITIAVSRPL